MSYKSKRELDIGIQKKRDNLKKVWDSKDYKISNYFCFANEHCNTDNPKNKKKGWDSKDYEIVFFANEHYNTDNPKKKINININIRCVFKYVPSFILYRIGNSCIPIME